MPTSTELYLSGIVKSVLQVYFLKAKYRLSRIFSKMNPVLSVHKGSSWIVLTHRRLGGNSQGSH